ncbi:SipW-dependent-type signal peptide-containing protein [Halorubrum sp. DTA46]|uniref:SipW-dependent-type signal peptide-containing protein n=1 Tax=Halorubrum sp. DTA46 TaxID=3402162 RepID=UPI003AAD6246
MTASRDRSGSDTRVSGLSRRRLLSSLGAVGAVGAASGSGTFAYLSDRETLASNDIGTGTLDLLIDGAVVDGPIEITVSGIDRGASGAETLTLGVRTNAARVWLATDCPEHGDDLAAALDVRLTVDDRPVSGGWRSFAAFRRVFVDGLRLDDGCLPPDEGVPVTLHWRLPGDVDDSLGGSRTEFAFRLYAEQCRHVSEDDATGSNPFAGLGPCDELPECAVCEDGDRFARLTFEYLGSDDAHVAARSRGAGQVGVAFEGPVSPGGTFTADGASVGDDGELGTNLYLDDGSDDQPGGSQGTGGGGGNGNSESQGDGNGGGNGGNNGRPPGLEVHTSCSEELSVGQLFGPSDAPRYRLVAGEVAGKGPICEQPTDDGPVEDN